MPSLEPNTSTTFLAIGDVHGHWDCVIEAIALAEAILGKVPDLVLQVGDAEPHRNEEDLAGCQKPKKYRLLGNFSALRQGDIRSPVYFIGGNHEPYVALDALPGPFPTPWGGDLSVYYLGRAGARILENRLKVAWLSGISSPNADPIRRSESPKTRTYFLDTEVATTIREACDLGDIDVLLTHDWPSELRCGPGNDATTEIMYAIRPTLHLCGHQHTALEGTIGTTVIHALNAVPPATTKQGRERFGWWRLYERDGSGSIRCLKVGT